jgi:hypothetical protein
VARPNWSRKLPRPLKIPTIMTLTTLADVRKLLGHLPAEFRERDTWQHVADRLHNGPTAAISKKPLSPCDWCCNSNKYHACRNDGCRKNEICRLLDRYGIELGQCGPKCQPAESRRSSSVSPCGLSVASPGASFHGLGGLGGTFSLQ